ncbi:hypothetical protein [Oceanobacillus kapialis]|uniref:Rho termination factor N-terminal domain-containing protein n=1 Tax=Oceanobacillus kapialis TaxID=481353 RepID=A0ABW5PZK9_9BACI
MKVEVRKTAQGTEYWDTEEKRTLFVPAGKKPSFEVTNEPKSMVGNEAATVDNDKGIDLANLNKEELLAFAKDHNITIPGNVSKEDKIREIIETSLTAAEEEK